MPLIIAIWLFRGISDLSFGMMPVAGFQQRRGCGAVLTRQVFYAGPRGRVRRPGR